MTGRSTPRQIRVLGALAIKLFIYSDLLLGGSIGKQKRYGR